MKLFVVLSLLFGTAALAVPVPPTPVPGPGPVPVPPQTCYALVGSTNGIVYNETGAALPPPPWPSNTVYQMLTRLPWASSRNYNTATYGSRLNVTSSQVSYVSITMSSSCSFRPNIDRNQGLFIGSTWNGSSNVYVFAVYTRDYRWNTPVMALSPIAFTFY